MKGYIHVTKRLPDVPGYVSVVDGDSLTPVKKLYFEDGKFYYRAYQQQLDYTDFVTHWKPLKIFPLMISKTFMSTHPRRGQKTGFKELICQSMASYNPDTGLAGKGKIHSMRDNYEYWARIADEVNAGRGVLSLRQWSGSPYNRQRDGSKPIEFMQLQQMGVQSVRITTLGNVIIDSRVLSIEEHSGFANADGLSQQDFYDWFGFGPRMRKDKDLVLIHFSSYRY